MPHKLPVGKSTSYGIGSISQRPALAQLVGQIANDWNYFERIMEELYARLMGRMYIATYLPKGTMVSHPVAFQIFEELESFRAKQNLVEALIRWALIKCPEDFDAYRKQTEKPIKSACIARNNAVHTLWGLCDEYPDALISQPTFGDRLVWRENDFKEELKKVREGLTAFTQATAKLDEFIRGDIASPCGVNVTNEKDGL